MTITETFIKDLYVIDYQCFKDNRGEFIKTIHLETFDKYNLSTNFTESYYSISHRNVIRGMHFQIPPDDHSKLVHLIAGEILDVVLDIRRTSPTYGKYFFIELTENKKQALYIGKGLAHGFMSRTDRSIVEYHTTTSHSAANEKGIHFNSFGFDWGLEHPIISERDLKQPLLKDFNNPF